MTTYLQERYTNNSAELCMFFFSTKLLEQLDIPVKNNFNPYLPYYP